MASRRGVVITASILAVITAASFLIWLVPDADTTFVITDYEGYLDGAKNIHEILQASIMIEYQQLIDGKIVPSEYVESAQATSSQVTSKISEFIRSKPPAEWEQSYINYMESMRSFNEFITETIVVAEVLDNGGSEDDVSVAMERAESVWIQSSTYAQSSDESRP